MSITIKEDRSGEVHKHNRRIEFDGAEPLVLGRGSYTHRGKQFIPVAARAAWDHGRPIEQIELSGPILKKNGKPGEYIASVTYKTPANRWWDRGETWTDPPAPAWLLELFGIEDVPTEDMGQ